MAADAGDALSSASPVTTTNAAARRPAPPRAIRRCLEVGLLLLRGVSIGLSDRLCVRFGFQLRRPELELRAVTPAKRRLEPRALAPGPQCCRTEPEQQEQHPATDEQPERVRPSRARRGLRPGAEDLREVLAG